MFQILHPLPTSIVPTPSINILNIFQTHFPWLTETLEYLFHRSPNNTNIQMMLKSVYKDSLVTEREIQLGGFPFKQYFTEVNSTIE